MELEETKRKVRLLIKRVNEKKARYSELTGERKAFIERLREMGLEGIRAAEIERGRLRKRIKQGREDVEAEVQELTEQLSFEENDVLLKKIANKEEDE